MLALILLGAVMPVLALGATQAIRLLGGARLTGFDVAVLAVLAAVPVAVWAFMRHRVPAGCAAATVDAEGIHSPLFTGRRKSFAWRDIVSAEARNANGQLQLALNLAIAPGEVPRKTLFGLSSTQPVLALNLFTAEDRETLTGAVLQRLTEGHAQDPAALAAGTVKSYAPPTTNAFAAERVYRDGLLALTPRPHVSWTLVALNIGVWVALVWASGGKLLNLPTDTLFIWGGNVAHEMLHQGAWWRLVASTFLHSGLAHIAMNMLALSILGPLAERLFGPRPFLVLYLVAGIAGSALSVCYAAQTMVSVGASGAIFGVAGALATTLFRHRRLLPPLSSQNKGGVLLYLLYSLAQGLGQSGVDNAAHVGGVVAGCLMAMLLPIRVGEVNIVRAARPGNGVTAAAAGLLLAVVLLALAPKQPWDIRALLATEAKLPGLVQRFQADLQLIQREGEAAKDDVQREWVWDNRLRDEIGPRLRALARDTDGLDFRPRDSRALMVEAMGRIAWRASQQMAMPSVPDPKTGRPIPADQPAFDALTEHIKEAVAQLNQANSAVQAETAKRGSAH